MKNNTLIMAGVGILAVAAVGGFLYMRSSGNSPIGLPSDPMKSMENALTGSGSVKCEYTDEEGRVTISYIKDGKIRSEFSDQENEPGGMIFKDNAMWTWNSATKEGFTMVLPEVEESTDSQYDDGDDFDQSPFNEKREIEEEIEKYKEQCNNERISDDMFEPPTDITFQDMSDFYQNMPQIPQE